MPVLFERSQPSRQLISIMLAHGVPRPHGSCPSGSPNTPKRTVQTIHILTRTIMSELAAAGNQGLNIVAAYAKGRDGFKQQSARTTPVSAGGRQVTRKSPLYLSGDKVLVIPPRPPYLAEREFLRTVWCENSQTIAPAIVPRRLRTTTNTCDTEEYIS